MQVFVMLLKCHFRSVLSKAINFEIVYFLIIHFEYFLAKLNASHLQIRIMFSCGVHHSFVIAKPIYARVRQSFGIAKPIPKEMEGNLDPPHPSGSAHASDTKVEIPSGTLHI